MRRAIASLCARRRWREPFTPPSSQPRAAEVNDSRPPLRGECCAGHTKLGGAPRKRPPPRGTESLDPRRARHPNDRGSGVFLVRAEPSEPPTKEEPMTDPTHAVGVDK